MFSFRLQIPSCIFQRTQSRQQTSCLAASRERHRNLRSGAPEGSAVQMKFKIHPRSTLFLQRFLQHTLWSTVLSVSSHLPRLGLPFIDKSKVPTVDGHSTETIRVGDMSVAHEFKVHFADSYTALLPCPTTLPNREARIAFLPALLQACWAELRLRPHRKLRRLHKRRMPISLTVKLRRSC